MLLLDSLPREIMWSLGGCLLVQILPKPRKPSLQNPRSWSLHQLMTQILLKLCVCHDGIHTLVETQWSSCAGGESLTGFIKLHLPIPSLKVQGDKNTGTIETIECLINPGQHICIHDYAGIEFVQIDAEVQTPIFLLMKTTALAQGLFNFCIASMSSIFCFSWPLQIGGVWCFNTPWKG